MSVALARAVVVGVVAVVVLVLADAASPMAASCEASSAPQEGWFPPPSLAAGMGRGGDRPLPGGGGKVGSGLGNGSGTGGGISGG